MGGSGVPLPLEAALLPLPLGGALVGTTPLLFPHCVMKDYYCWLYPIILCTAEGVYFDLCLKFQKVIFPSVNMG